MTQRKPPEERSPRSGSEKRQRNKVALVRMNEAEHQALTAAMAATGKGASTLLRDAFLAGQDETAIRVSERRGLGRTLLRRHAPVRGEWGLSCPVCWARGGSRAAWPCAEALAITAAAEIEGSGDRG